MGVLDFVNTGMQLGAQVLNQINQRKVWEREDNAVQRRVADLKAAGLSPTLAAGSAAGVSAPIRVEAPRITRDIDIQNAGIGKTGAETNLIKQKESNEWAGGYEKRVWANYLNNLGGNEVTKKLFQDYFDTSIERTIAENKRSIKEAGEYSRNVDIARQYGIPSNSNEGYELIAKTKLLKNAIPELEESKAAGWSVVLRTLMSLLGK